MNKKLEVMLIGSPDNALLAYIAARIAGMKKIETLDIHFKVIIVDPWEINKEDKRTSMEEMLKKMAEENINATHFDSGPSRLVRRKEANLLRKFQHKNVKTKFKSLKR